MNFQGLRLASPTYRLHPDHTSHVYIVDVEPGISIALINSACCVDDHEAKLTCEQIKAIPEMAALLAQNLASTEYVIEQGIRIGTNMEAHVSLAKETAELLARIRGTWIKY